MSDAIKNNQSNEQISETIIIKKYANRRLYNMAKSQYVKLENLSELIQNGYHFVVYEATTGEDITRSVLTQIIAEQESKGQNMLPLSFLRDVIKFYNHKVSDIVPHYWENTMRIFKDHQNQLQKNLGSVIDQSSFPFQQFKKVSDKNTEFFQQAAKIFNPFFTKPSDENDTLVTLKKDEYQKLIDQLEALALENKSLKQDLSKAIKPQSTSPKKETRKK